ncbi:MAG: hypothetical protein E6767_04945 [Dysgonomonas sp.]|nr:hypothetical protein [Dysgonomonas sp.]
MKKKSIFLFLFSLLLLGNDNCFAQSFGQRDGRRSKKESRESNETKKTDNQEKESSGIEIKTPHSKLEAKFVSLEVQGKDAYLTYTVTSKGGDLQCEFRGQAYDDLGNECKTGVTVGGTQGYYSYINGKLLADVPLKVEVRISNINTSATKLSKILIAGKSYGNSDYTVNGNFTLQNIELKNQEASSTSSTEKSTVTDSQEKKSSSIEIKSPHSKLEAKFVSLKIQGRDAYLTYTVIRKGGDLQCEFRGEAYDNLGNKCKTGVTVGGTQGYYSYINGKLLADVPLKVEVKISDINTSATMLSKILIASKSYGNSDYTVNGNFTLQNVPLKTQQAVKQEPSKQENSDPKAPGTIKRKRFK